MIKIKGTLHAVVEKEKTVIDFEGNGEAIVAILDALKNRFPKEYEVFLDFQQFKLENNIKDKYEIIHN